MTENEIAKQILDAAFVVHTSLGPGLLESVYEVGTGLRTEKERSNSGASKTDADIVR